MPQKYCSKSADKLPCINNCLSLLSVNHYQKEVSGSSLYQVPGFMDSSYFAEFEIALGACLRMIHVNGFFIASINLVTNLRDQLERFKAKVKEAPDNYVVEHKHGYAGGGSMGAVCCLVWGESHYGVAGGTKKTISVYSPVNHFRISYHVRRAKA
jgi:hypothetical protein